MAKSMKKPNKEIEAELLKMTKEDVAFLTNLFKPKAAEVDVDVEASPDDAEKEKFVQPTGTKSLDDVQATLENFDF